MRRLRLVVFAAFSVLEATVLAGSAQAAQYYMVMFGYQGAPNLARTSHTFATFVAVEGQAVTEEVTVSWLPAPGYFGPGNSMPVLRAVPGHNYTLDETIGLAGDAQIQYWGPYQITDSLFAQAEARAGFLSEGTTSYKMIVLDEARREPALYNQPGGVINCIMAVSDLGGYLDTGTNWGYAASSQVLGWLSRWTYDYPQGTHADVAQLMQLDERLGR
jgi:hypothetical protein